MSSAPSLELSPTLGNSHSPTSSRRNFPKSSFKWLLILGALFGVASIGTAGYFFLFGLASSHEDLVLHTVQYEPLRLTIVERGTLQSANNNDIVCEVKSGTKGSTVATTIKWVIEDGSQVKKGDKLVDLDESGLEEQLKIQKIAVAQAKAAQIQAKANYDIVKNQNETDIAVAHNKLELAILALHQYAGKARPNVTDVPAMIAVAPGYGFFGNIPWAGFSEMYRFEGGEFGQASQDIEGQILMGRSDLEMWEERTAWSIRMSLRGYVTPSQAQADRARLASARLQVKKLEESHNVLKKFFAVHKRKELEGLIAEARSLLEQAYIKRVGTEAQAAAELEAKNSIYDQEQRREEDIIKQIGKCKIYSPQDGMVVYYVAPSRRFSSSNQTMIAQGEPVSEAQKLMQIPDLTNMIVDTKVHEAMVSQVRPGLPATVRIEAFPDRLLNGHVLSVATVASQTQWLASDVKVYQTFVAIDETLPGLKPGMSAEITILTDSQVENALTVPIQAIVGSAEMGTTRTCFVMTPEGPQKRTIVVGISNERMAEIKSGLEEGDKVVLNPRALMGDDARVREAKQPGKGPSKDRSFNDRDPAPKQRPPAKEGPGGAAKSGAGGRDPAKAKAFFDRIKNASPAERKQMVDKSKNPAELRKRLQAQGIEVPQ